MAVGYQDVVFRSRLGRTLAIVALIFGVLAVIGFSTNQGPIAGGIAGLVAVIVFVGLYLSLWRPRLEVRDEGILVVNPFSTHRLEWSEVRSAEMRWALTINTEEGRRISVYAVPRSSQGADAAGMRLDPFKLPDYQAQQQHERQDFSSRADSAALRVIQSHLENESR